MNTVAIDNDVKRRWFVVLLAMFIAAVAGMGVLWVNSLPRLTQEEGRISIANCELPLPTYAIGACPKLYCKKEILESGLFPPHSQIGFNKPKPSGHQIIAGAVRYPAEGSKEVVIKHFECELNGYKVRGLKFL